ncbi:hypothetical protein DFH09DRAFT_1117184, partial [Mycena vulgaris]
SVGGTAPKKTQKKKAVEVEEEDDAPASKSKGKRKQREDDEENAPRKKAAFSKRRKAPAPGRSASVVPSDTGSEPEGPNTPDTPDANTGNDIPDGAARLMAIKAKKAAAQKEADEAKARMSAANPRKTSKNAVAGSSKPLKLAAINDDDEYESSDRLDCGNAGIGWPASSSLKMCHGNDGMWNGNGVTKFTDPRKSTHGNSGMVTRVTKFTDFPKSTRGNSGTRVTKFTDYFKKSNGCRKKASKPVEMVVKCQFFPAGAVLGCFRGNGGKELLRWKASTPKKAHIPGITGSPATPRNTKPPVPASPLPVSLATRKAPRMPTFEHSGSPPPLFANPELPAFAAVPLSTPGVAALMPPDMHFAPPVRRHEPIYTRGELFGGMFFSTRSTESAADELGALAWNLDMMGKERKKEEMEREVAFLAQRQLATTRRKAAIQQAHREVSRIKAEDEGFDTGLGIEQERAESTDMEQWMLDNRRDVHPEEDFDPRFENQPADDL